MGYDVSWSNKFEIKPKRWVFIPTTECLINGRGLVSELKIKWIQPDFYFHLRAGGHVSAVKLHLANTYFAKLDLHDFFGSISRSRVTRALRSFYSYEDARGFAKMSTVPQCGDWQHSHSLPYGFAQSPMLASLCLEKSYLGIVLSKCRESKDVCVTVYMDDILISSKSNVSLQFWYDSIILSAEKSKFIINKDKSHGPETETTIFNIKLSALDLKVERQRFASFYDKYNKSENPSQKKGIGSYVGTVNKVQALELDM
ncbi:hypothetical protein A1L58_04660 [Shewanella baltica]|uniref:reverse transcriptase domain-containing protein n=1 Tax=Shewanella baltica TaxID=62322 RepID=UPI0007B4C36E|nr:reverse transcriptase domain-containing protein [Shewanella baltica]KZK66709.1 hypothetical protein A1L58_04660 [Shewanella baltica]